MKAKYGKMPSSRVVHSHAQKFIRLGRGKEKSQLKNQLFVRFASTGDLVNSQDDPLM